MLPRRTAPRDTPSVMQHAVVQGRDSWIRSNTRSYRPLPPRPPVHRVFGELEVCHHALAGLRTYAINMVASGGGFHLRYYGAISVTLSDKKQLLPVNLVCSNGYHALIGYYLVDMFLPSDLPCDEEHFVAFGRQVIPLVGVLNLEPGGILGVAHAPLMCVPLDALQHDGWPSDPSTGSPGVTPISAVTAKPLGAAVATASSLPALIERLTPKQRASFLRL